MTALPETSFAEFVATNRFVLVHFWATWNGVDDQMRAFLETEVVPEVRNQVAFGTLDADKPEHFDLCRSHQVVNLPFLALYRDGVLSAALVGMDKQKIVRLLNELVRPN